MSYALRDREANVWTQRGSSNRLDLGPVSLRYLLADARSLGNQSDRIPAEYGSTVDPTHGGPTATIAGLDNFRVAVGCDCVDEYGSPVHVPALPALADVLLAAEFASLHQYDSVYSHGYLSYDSLAGAELRDLRKVRIHTRQSSARNAHGE